MPTRTRALNLIAFGYVCVNGGAASPAALAAPAGPATTAFAGCGSCSAGRFCTVSCAHSSGGCFVCLPGTYQPYPSQACGCYRWPGTYASTVAQSCSTGTIQAASDSTSCAACPSGSYCATTGLGNETAGLGAVARSCAAGQHATASASMNMQKSIIFAAQETDESTVK